MLIKINNTMKTFLLILTGLVFCLNSMLAEGKPKDPLPPIGTGSDTENRDICSPQLYQDDSSVYVYSEIQLDNVTIGITDMQGNTYHYEVTTIPAGTYYAVSIDSLPAGMYYLCVYQGSKYVIGMFTID